MELTGEGVITISGFDILMGSTLSSVWTGLIVCELNRFLFELKILLRKLLIVREKDRVLVRSLFSASPSLRSKKYLKKHLESYSANYFRVF